MDAYGELLKPDVVKAFEKYGVLNERELHARYEVALEHYNKTINIEAQLMVLLANRYILPAAYRYQGELASSVAAVKAAGATAKESKKALDTLCRLTDQAKSRADAEYFRRMTRSGLQNNRVTLLSLLIGAGVLTAAPADATRSSPRRSAARS